MAENCHSKNFHFSLTFLHFKNLHLLLYLFKKNFISIKVSYLKRIFFLLIYSWLNLYHCFLLRTMRKSSDFALSTKLCGPAGFSLAESFLPFLGLKICLLFCNLNSLSSLSLAPCASAFKPHHHSFVGKG